MFDIRHGIAPKYITELCERCDDSQMRSSACRPSNFMVCQGVVDKAFSATGPCGKQVLILNSHQLVRAFWTVDLDFSF